MRTTLLFWVLTACHSGGSSSAAVSQELAPIDVQTATIATAAMPTHIQLTGSILADRQVQVAADVNGVVVATRVERGQQVRKGDVIAVVDTRVSQLSAKANSAQAEAQSAQLAAAEADCKRADDLHSQGVISDSQYERSRAACEAQRQAVAAARAAADITQTNLGKTSIRAPFDGIVGERMVEVGAFVSSASPVATLYAAGGLRVRFPVPEFHISGVEIGRRVEVVVSSQPDRRFPGTVQYVSGALREATRDLVVEAVLDQPDPALRPGMFARVDLETGEQSVAVVPASAIRAEGTVHRLFLVREGRAFEQVVRVGSTRDGQTAVLTDVAAGDVVVVSPPESLRDGQKVE